MNYNQLGASDLHISEIGFGCMALNSDDREAAGLLQTAFDAGINYFDTADIYDNGRNELLVGKALHAFRDKVVIASKVGNVIRKDGKGLDWDPSSQHILHSVEESLRRLQTDYIDLYQLHGGTIGDRAEETIGAFELLKKQGKIRHYGISSIRPNVIRQYVERSSIASVMMQYSLLDRRPEEESLGLLQKAHIGVLARGSVAQGLLAGKPAKAYLGRSEEEVLRASATVASVSGTLRTAAHTALRYVLHHPAVTAAVVGIRTAAHLKEALEVSLAPPLSAGDLGLLNSSSTENFYKEHR